MLSRVNCISKLNPAIYRKGNTHDQVWFIPGMQGLLTVNFGNILKKHSILYFKMMNFMFVNFISIRKAIPNKTINVVHHNNRLEKKKTVILIGTEKEFDKMQYPFIIFSYQQSKN